MTKATLSVQTSTGEKYTAGCNDIAKLVETDNGDVIITHTDPLLSDITIPHENVVEVSSKFG
ncbi:MAG: hypothetical protein LBT80_00330 [Lactobacillaceae bacterium]|jgi:hypothetical protein|nr:hypothetical protein [Lactobacillaceae bacterium]